VEGQWDGSPFPVTLVGMTTSTAAATAHRTPDELEAFLPQLLAAPRDAGTLELVVRRPTLGEREVLDEGELDTALGLVGDSWCERGSSRTTDGGPHPQMQLNVMSARMVAFLAGDPARRALAGDQLYLDLDLSQDNLPAGTRLTIGDPHVRGAVIEVTEVPHTGCAKFVERFGAEAMRFVNGGVGRPMRLRGLNARVVVPGRVRPGDPVRVTRP
jgi:MOSC domain-containing protein YiiM